MENYYYICGAETTHILCWRTPDISGASVRHILQQDMACFCKNIGSIASLVYTN